MTDTEQTQLPQVDRRSPRFGYPMLGGPRKCSFDSWFIGGGVSQRSSPGIKSPEKTAGGRGSRQGHNPVRLHLANVPVLSGASDYSLSLTLRNTRRVKVSKQPLDLSPPPPSTPSTPSTPPPICSKVEKLQLSVQAATPCKSKKVNPHKINIVNWSILFKYKIFEMWNTNMRHCCCSAQW